MSKRLKLSGKETRLRLSGNDLVETPAELEPVASQAVPKPNYINRKGGLGGKPRDPSGNQWPASKRGNNKRAGTIANPGDPKLVFDELTTGQSGILYGIPQAPLVMLTDPSVTTLFRKYLTTYEEYRRIRKDPTIALCRAVITGPILSSQWAVKSNDGAPKGAAEFIEKQMVKRRFKLMDQALHGMIDFGWQGFEKVFETILDNDTGKKRVGIRKIKPLLQDMTSIMIDLYTGDFMGFRQGIVFVEAPAKAMLCSFRVEGTMWHGYPLLEDARATVEKWENVEVGAQRYDRKMAGTHFVVYYPFGKSLYGGVLVDNEKIARGILANMESSGCIMMPSSTKSFVEGLEGADDGENAAWRIELLENRGGRAATFTDRERYLDSLKSRAMRVPERAIMEGQFGTKAEAQGHQDIMTVLLENLDFQVTDEVNEQVVNQLMFLNWGKDSVGTVWLESPPVSDDKIDFMRNMLTSILTNPSGFMELFPHLDSGAILKLLDVPTVREVPEVDPNALKEQAQPGLPPNVIQAVQQMGLQPGQPAPINRLKGLPVSNGKTPIPAANGKPAPGQPVPPTPGQPTAPPIPPKPPTPPAPPMPPTPPTPPAGQDKGLASQNGATKVKQKG